MDTGTCLLGCDLLRENDSGQPPRGCQGWSHDWTQVHDGWIVIGCVNMILASLLVDARGGAMIGHRYTIAGL